MSTRFPTRPAVPTFAPRTDRLRTSVQFAVRLLVGLGCLASLLAVGYGAMLLLPPSASGLTLSNAASPSEPAYELRVFDLGAPISMAYTIERSSAGHRVGVRLINGDQTVAAPALVQTLAGEETGLQRLQFTPQDEGIYTAALVVNGAALADEQVRFKVIKGGTRLRSLVSARGVDGATYQPLGPSSAFAPSDTVHLVYKVAQARAGDTIGVAYTVNGQRQQPLPEDRRTLVAGDLSGYFAISGASERGLTTGDYRAEVYYNNDLVAIMRFAVAH